MEKRLTLRPFSRLEGDLEIKVQVKNGKVVNSQCSGVMFRGFENLLLGREIMDALVFVCRICGVCGVSQSLAAVRALQKVFAVEMPPNGYLATNIILATEVLLNQFSHFYLSFAPDLVNRRYTSHPLYPEVVRRFSPFSGTSYQKIIEVRKKLLVIMGIFAGKWPNTLALHPGGTTKPVNKSEIIKCLGSLKEFQNFVEEIILGCEIKNWLSNKTVEDMERWARKKENARSDLGIFICFGKEIGLPQLGRGPGKFIGSREYNLSPGKSWYYKEGFYDGNIHHFDKERISEEHTFSWYENGKVHPFQGFTRPQAKKRQAYSWSKSPRYGQEVVEVGPLARMIINQDPLITDLFRKSGSNVYTRVLARLQEAIKLLPKLSLWIEQIDWNNPFYNKPAKISQKKGEGLVEAARGTLGHWIRVEDGRIKNYQIITPTTWNFSPRDSLNNPGTLEQALIGTPVRDRKDPVEIFHIVRSYDPCLFCSVHMIKLR